MRLVFFGSGEFAVSTLEALARDGQEVAAVVSQPDRPYGRGGKTRSTPLAAKAEEMGVPVLKPEKPNTPEFAAELRLLRPELAVIVAYGHLIKPLLLEIPPLGFVNLHASLLPAYRGAAPVPWAILKGETVSGATVFRLNEKFDAGAVLGRVRLPILPDDTSGSYLEKLAPLGAALMRETVRALAEGTAEAQPQDEGQASPAPKFTKEDGRLDWTRPFAELERKVRALSPWPLGFTFLPTPKGCMRVNVGKLVGGEAAEKFNKNNSEFMKQLASVNTTRYEPGQIMAADAKAGLWVMTGDAPARLTLLQPEGKRMLQDTDFLRGIVLTEGSTLDS